MNKKLRELLAKKAQLITDAQKALETGKIQDATTLRDEVKAVSNEIEILQDLLAAEGAAVPATMDEAMDAAKKKAAESGLEDKSKVIRQSNEYVRAFFTAITNGVSLKQARGQEQYNVLFDAMSETGGNPAGAEGGFLLPVDFNNKINELRRAFTPLADLFNIENVTATSGWRVFEKAATMAAFAAMTELQAIGTEAGPQFTKVTYAIADYGGIIQVANDLIDDTFVGLMAYLSKWMARKSVVTENSLLKTMITTQFNAPTEYDFTKGISPLKKILNVTLDPALSVGAVIVTNQDGYAVLDDMNDAQGRPLLQPDPTNATGERIAGRRVVILPNTVWASRVDAGDANHRKAPLLVGALSELGTMFRRMPYEMAATNIGAGAFESNSTKVRGIIRLDNKITDSSAATLQEFDLGV